MRKHQGTKLLVLLALILAAPLAGCLEDAPGPDDGSDTTDGDVDSSEARTRYSQALSSLQGESDGGEIPQRVSMVGTFEDANGTEVGTMRVLADPDAQFVLFTVSGDLASTGSPSGSNAEEILVGQVGKTTVLGTLDTALAMYNASAEPVEGFGAAGGEDVPDAGSTSADLTDPASILQNLEEVPEGAEVTATYTTYQGKDALEVHVEDTANGTSITLTMWLDPDRPALIEATLGPNATTHDDLDASSYRMEFQYGDDANHPRARAVQRLASMAFLTDDEATDMSSGGDEGPSNWTIQPNPHSGTVPLTEATGQVVNASYGDTPDDTVLELALEDGTAENDHVRLTYDDADGDGYVSQGDTITLTPLTDEGSYQLVLLDEDTGMRLVPGSTVMLALLGLTLGSALAAGRRGR